MLAVSSYPPEYVTQCRANVDELMKAYKKVSTAAANDAAVAKFAPLLFNHLVLALDEENARELRRLAPNDDARAKIRLLREFDKDAAPGAEVPDPYYGGPEGFDLVFDICLAACRGLLLHLQKAYLPHDS